MTRRVSALAAALAALCALAAEPEPNPHSAQAPAAPGYVGDATCIECHEALHPGFTRKFQDTLHGHVLNPTNGRTELAAHGCESCHGPGQAHVDAGGGKGVGGFVPFGESTPEAVKRVDEVCMACHKGDARTYWPGSVHDVAEVGCTACHTLMENVSQSRLLAAKTEVETCARCHPTQFARTFRNAHMPLRPGDFQVSTATNSKMSCTSCHQPHGSVTPSLIKQLTVNDQCLECHAEKRGPFLWEHSPVTENCLNCHEPHGSTRDAMLKMNVIRLCQSCHVSTGHATSPRNPNDRFAVANSCLQCHTQIHGSNHPSGFVLTR